VLIIVVRYFGGVLLGVPGLINSYKNAAALALQVTKIISQPVMTNYRLEFDYTKMNEVMKLIKQFECPVLQQEILLFCTLHISIPQIREEEVLHKLKNLQGVNIEKH
jgi:putative IMPACT (imprinted ancient) family translation regulator